MLHGWPDDWRLWDGTVAALQDRWRCARCTLPGFDIALPPRPVPLDAMTDWLRKVADAVSPGQPVTLVLHDWGCVFGYEFAMRHPERVARIVAVDVGDFLSPALHAELGPRGRWLTARYQLWLALAWVVGRAGATGARQPPHAVAGARAALPRAPGLARLADELPLCDEMVRHRWGPGWGCRRSLPRARCCSSTERASTSISLAGVAGLAGIPVRLRRGGFARRPLADAEPGASLPCRRARLAGGGRAATVPARRLKAPGAPCSSAAAPPGRGAAFRHVPAYVRKPGPASAQSRVWAGCRTPAGRLRRAARCSRSSAAPGPAGNAHAHGAPGRCRPCRRA
jgi:pimeloyl-ACP methyl ester carboxylesterase